MSTMVTSTLVTTSPSTTTNLTNRSNTRTPSTSSSTSTINDLESNGHYFPSLYELIDNCISLDSSNETLSAFNNYLESRHCPENLQFIIDINNYLHLSNTTRIELLKTWQFLYDKYLTFDADLEINIPCNLKSQLSIVELPSYEILSRCKKHIYDDLLINLYREFTKQYHEDIYRPCLCKRRTSSIEQIKHHQQTEANPPAKSASKHHSQHHSRQPLKHSVSLNLPLRSKHSDDNVCPREKVTPITSPISHHENGDHHHHSHRRHHSHHSKQYGGYDYYTIPSTESSSEEEHSDGANTRSNSRNNSTSSSSRGSSIGSIVDSSVIYFNKMKKFKFGRRFSNDE